MSFIKCLSHSANYDEFIKLKRKTQQHTNVLSKPGFGSSVIPSKKTPPAKVSVICNNAATDMIYGHWNQKPAW